MSLVWRFHCTCLQTFTCTCLTLVAFDPNHKILPYYSPIPSISPSAALFRLATARTSLKQDDEAMADFERLLKLEPSNKKAQDQLRLLRARHEAGGPAGEKLLKKNRLHIVEVEGCGREEEEEGEGVPADLERMKELLSKLEETKQKVDEISADLRAKKAEKERREKGHGGSKRSEDGLQPDSGGKFPGKLATGKATTTKVGGGSSSHNSDMPHPPTQTTPTAAQATPIPPQATPTAAQATPTPVAQVPLPPAVQRLKEEGNKLFRSGQYTEASEKYSMAISLLEQGKRESLRPFTFSLVLIQFRLYCEVFFFFTLFPSLPPSLYTHNQRNPENDRQQHSSSLATLLNNRAACSLKTGQCNSCISDCSRSISLLPLNHKAVLRRARAYEMKEK